MYMKLYNILLRPVEEYGSETWVWEAETEK